MTTKKEKDIDGHLVLLLFNYSKKETETKTKLTKGQANKDNKKTKTKVVTWCCSPSSPSTTRWFQTKKKSETKPDKQTEKQTKTRTKQRQSWSPGGAPPPPPPPRGGSSKKNQKAKTSKQRQQKNKDKDDHLVLLPPLLLHHEVVPGRCQEEDRRAFQKPENIIQDLENLARSYFLTEKRLILLKLRVSSLKFFNVGPRNSSTMPFNYSCSFTS